MLVGDWTLIEYAPAEPILMLLGLDVGFSQTGKSTGLAGGSTAATAPAGSTPPATTASFQRQLMVIKVALD